MSFAFKDKQTQTLTRCIFNALNDIYKCEYCDECSLKRCLFVKKGCINGINCLFCHDFTHSHKEDYNIWHRPSKNTREKYKAIVNDTLEKCKYKSKNERDTILISLASHHKYISHLLAQHITN